MGFEGLGDFMRGGGDESEWEDGKLGGGGMEKEEVVKSTPGDTGSADE